MYKACRGVLMRSGIKLIIIKFVSKLHCYFNFCIYVYSCLRAGILLPQIRCSIVEGDFAKDCTCAEWIFLWHIRQTHPGVHRHYTQTSCKFLELLKTKKAEVSWMCFIITAHHNLCHQLKIHHLYGTLISQPSVFVWGPELVCLRFSWKGAPSTKENRICSSEN